MNQNHYRFDGLPRFFQRSTNTTNILIVTIATFWWLKHQNPSTRTGDMIISSTASCTIISLRYVCRIISCNIQVNTILTARLDGTERGDNNSIFTRQNQTYHRKDTTFPVWLIVIDDVNAFLVFYVSPKTTNCIANMSRVTVFFRFSLWKDILLLNFWWRKNWNWPKTDKMTKFCFQRSLSLPGTGPKSQEVRQGEW